MKLIRHIKIEVEISDGYVFTRENTQTFNDYIKDLLYTLNEFIYQHYPITITLSELQDNKDNKNA